MPGKLSTLDMKRIPKHIGIIMDGNRRWAAQNGLKAVQGHEAGVDALTEIVDHCLALGVKTLTVYALSTENWRKRAKEEVRGIFGLLIRLVNTKKEEYAEKGIKLAVLGNFQAFPRKVAKAIEVMLQIVKRNERLKLNIALNYGGRDEIIRAIQQMVKDGVPAEKITEESFGKYLYTSGEADPDLLIRTGGEKRLSNFLLWQLSYSELYFTETLWPDFSPKKLDEAIVDFQKRERRFGGGQFQTYTNKLQKIFKPNIVSRILPSQ